VTPLVPRLFTRSAGLSRRECRLLGAGFLALGALVALTALNAILDLGGAALYPIVRDDASSAVYLLVAGLITWRAMRVSPRRLPFLLLAGGIAMYLAGNVVWSLWIARSPHPPIPSIADAMWLSLYPLASAPLIAHLTARYSRPPLGVVLDGLLAGAGLTAVGAALSLSPVLHGLSHSVLANATELAYPAGDLLIAGLTLGIIAVRGWQVDRALGSYAVGFLLCAVADFLYAQEVAGGATSPHRPANLFYVLSVSAIAVSAWQQVPMREQRRASNLSVLLVPSGFTLTALGLLVWDRLAGLNIVAFWLAALTMLIAVGRLMVAFREAAGLSEARRLAATDELTDLANRRHFLAAVQAGVGGLAVGTRRPAAGGESQAAEPERLAVLLLDLDNFKQLNDTLGHHAGDELLRRVGPRLRDALRTDDLIARLGGDEFAVLLCPAPQEAGIAQVAERILGSLRTPFSVQGLALRVTGSVGIAVSGPHPVDAETLMQNADVAMYQAKRNRDGYEFYARERDTNSRGDLAMGADLARAIKARELEVWFQPKADAEDRGLLGAEALVRWRRDGRMVPPMTLVATAERSGLARPLTRLVLEAALTQLAGWRARGLEVDVAVNTTVADLLDERFPDEVTALLADAGVPAEALVLEITETSVLADPVRIGGVLERLRALGVRLSLDDFGTGYSSLAHLRNLTVDELKIDRSFVSRMVKSDADAAIVYAMVALGHTLGIHVVAEGVEDEATLIALQGLGADVIQGYLISPPVTAPEMLAALQEDRVVRAAAPR
jgi:diguanylate cyclase (GGDEF)-like protein